MQTPETMKARTYTLDSRTADPAARRQWRPEAALAPRPSRRRRPPRSLATWLRIEGCRYGGAA